MWIYINIFFKCVIINNCKIIINIFLCFIAKLACVGLKKSHCLGSWIQLCIVTYSIQIQTEPWKSACIQESLPHSYLLFLCFLQISPFLCKLTEVHFIHLQPHIPNSIMFGETVKVIHCHDQRLSSELCIWNLQTEYYMRVFMYLTHILM